MSYLGSVTLVGTLGSDIELRFAQSGKAVCKFGIAVSKKDKNTGVQQTVWVDVTAFDKLAEHVAATFTKGDKVLVFGDPDPIEYEKKDGSGRVQKLGVLANSIGPSLEWVFAEIQRTERTDVKKATSGLAQAGLLDETDPFE